MRIDLDTCRDPDLLAAEVRRLESVIAASHPTLTDEEREAIAYYIGTGGPDKVDATLRKLLERL